MLSTRTRASVFGLAMLLAAAVAVTTFAVRLGPAGAEEGRECSVKHVAGTWLFATQVGHLPAPAGDITALGTMNIDREGNVTGEFDVTIEPDTFGPGVPYEGSIVVSANCRGTLTFVTPMSARTDSIAILSDNEMWGMSQDPANLWTYEVRRISGQPHQ